MLWLRYVDIKFLKYVFFGCFTILINLCDNIPVVLSLKLNNLIFNLLRNCPTNLDAIFLWYKSSVEVYQIEWDYLSKVLLSAHWNKFTMLKS